MKADNPSANKYMNAEFIWPRRDPAVDFFESRARSTVTPVGNVDTVVSLAMAVELVVEDTEVVFIVPEFLESSISSPEEADEAPENDSEGPEVDDPEEKLPDTGVGSTSLGMATDPT